MKKVLLAILGLVLLSAVSLYVFIPSRITISRSITIDASGNALMRKLANAPAWKEWWPGNKENKESGRYLINDITFSPGPAKAVSVPVMLAGAQFQTNSELTIISHQPDSTTLNLEAIIPVSLNPVKRLEQYSKTRKLATTFNLILQSIAETYSKTINLYGYDIQKRLVTDSILVSTFEEVRGYPSVAKIYQLIDQLKDHIKKNDAAETGYPMLNIFTADSVNYVVKTAIPVNKKLPAAGNISYKWMLGGGNILITEVRGGQDEINEAYRQIINYISDHSRTAPAIPFESLVTDRRKEADSSKWITRIYYPVI